MKFLQASNIIKEMRASEKQSLVLLSSGQTENLDIYIRAEFALRNIDCDISHIPFNTLEQHLLNQQPDERLQFAVLLPWDFLPSFDWRTGISSDEPDLDAAHRRISYFSNLLQSTGTASCYCNAIVPPISANKESQDRITRLNHQSALETCNLILDDGLFNLEGYLENGIPFSGHSCGVIANSIVETICTDEPKTKKLIVTDLDNVMWRGVIGEDTIDGIQYTPEGAGYIHYIYQTWLKKLKNAGILIAVVSKNDQNLAELPFSQNNMVLDKDDIVSFQASYYAKSGQITNIAKQLNLGLESFVFIDDNPVELEEVKLAHPKVETIQFPEKLNQLPQFLNNLASLFNIRNITQEDQIRTTLYKTRLKGVPMPNLIGEGSDLTDFLKNLHMDVTIFDRTHGDNERALQLVNKTNQFNLNGHRVSRSELDQKLHNGARLYTVSVSDRYGQHGEILVCLINANLHIETLVMSCRVFQRKVENLFLCWLARQHASLNRETMQLLFHKTERNTPVGLFFQQNDVLPVEGKTDININDFIQRNSVFENLFKVTAE